MSDNGHILVVDDQKEICDVVQEYLTGEGYRVSTANDGNGMRRALGQSHVDLVILDLMLPGGEEVRLTTGEFDLLAAFVNNPNQVLSRDRLLDLARNREAGPFDRTIDVQVGRLRRKLEEDPQNPSLIKTVRGSGYIFTPTVEMS